MKCCICGMQGSRITSIYTCAFCDWWIDEIIDCLNRKEDSRFIDAAVREHNRVHGVKVETDKRHFWLVRNGG